MRIEGRKVVGKRVKNKKAVSCIFSFLLIASVLLPVPVRAADNTIEKEKTFTASSDSESEFAKSVSFAKTINENGETYQLGDVTYKVTTREYLDKKEKTVESALIENGQIYEPEETITENGVLYTLKDYQKEVVKEPYDKAVTAYEDYRYVVTASEVPATKTVTTVNDETGESESVTCSLSGISNIGSTVVPNQMNITFEVYDASYYQWNGNLIPKNDEVPALAGYESELLASIGAGSGSSITGIAWSGEAYMSDGILCRDAVANIQQVVPVYRAEYTGALRIDAEKGSIYKSTYETEDTDGRIKVEGTAIATYTLEEKETIIPYILMAGAGIVIFSCAIAIILVVLSKKRGEKK